MLWAAALGALLALNRYVFAEYLAFARETGSEQIGRLDNGALVRVAWEIGRTPLLLLTLAFMVVLLVLAVRRYPMTSDNWGLWTWLGIAAQSMMMLLIMASPDWERMWLAGIRVRDCLPLAP
jgi:hypothetical protein